MAEDQAFLIRVARAVNDLIDNSEAIQDVLAERPDFIVVIGIEVGLQRREEENPRQAQQEKSRRKVNDSEFLKALRIKPL